MARSWSFPPFRLDLDTGSLWRDDTLVPLPPKAVAVLAALVAQAGQVVTKEALFAAAWPETAVTDGVLKGCIRQIRRALGERGRTARYIATVHWRGYRFCAPVTPVEAPGSGAVPDGRGAATAPHAPSPVVAASPAGLVGRAAELAQLQQRWAQACEGRRQVVFVTGEAGIGKTTLVDAFVAQLAATAAVWSARGQCIEHYGAGEAYLPLLEALGQLGRGPGGAHVVALLRQVAPTWLLQLPSLVPEAAHEAVQRRAGGAMRERMLRELAEAVEGLTAQRPLVLVLEDLHWSDYATMDWLALVARRRVDTRLLVLGTYRPADAIARTHPVRSLTQELQRHGQCTEMLLPYLPEAGVATYLAQRFDAAQFPAGIAHLLHQRTSGNAFFLVTVVEELVRQGLLTLQGEGWTLRGGLEAMAACVPESIRQLIEHQLAQTTPAAQEILAAASVAGAEFVAAAVAASLGQATADVEACCDALVRQGQFLQAGGSTEWPDGTVAARYRFVHDLYREVLYARVPVSRRVQWHQRIGTRLEAGYGPQARELAAELAEHFVRGRDLERAVQYLRYAGENAVQRGAPQEAVACFEQGLAVVQQLPQRRDTMAQAIDLYFDLRTALAPLGQLGRVLDCLRAAETLAEALEDQQRLGWVSTHMSFHCFMTGDPEGARVLGQRALATANGDMALQVVTNHHLSHACYVQGDYRQAMDLCRKNVALLAGDLRHERFGLSGLPAVLSRANLTWCLAELGAFVEGRTWAAEGIRMAEEAAHAFSLISACRGLGFLCLRQGNLQTAITALERGLRLCQDTDIRNWLPWLTSALGYAYALSGRVTEALPLLERAVEQSVALQLLVFHAELQVFLSEGYALAGRLDNALDVARRAYDRTQATGERCAQAWTLRLLGDIHTQHAPPAVEPAHAYYHHALTLAEALGMRPLMAHCHLGLGQVYAQMAQREQAHAELSAAMTLYRTMQMPFWCSQAEAARAQVPGH